MEQMPNLSITTRHALQEAILTPRFYTTDVAAIDAFDIERHGLGDEFEWIRAEFERDYNKNHFRRNEEFLADFDAMPARQLFIEFLERSCTAEFSGCVLYAELAKQLKHRTLRSIFQSMSRDEGRHAGFLNQTLADLNVKIDLGVLQKRKRYTYFQPKFVFYTVYLSEKIGYARYITLHRHFEQNPQYLIHPIFKWFEEWCNDEYRHGEFFALMLRSQPQLLHTPANRRWMRFFMLAVYATMYLNDSRRSEFYQTLGLDWRKFDQEAIWLCNRIATQVFPEVMPLEDPRFFRYLDMAAEYDRKANALAEQGGPLNLARAAQLRSALALRLLATYRLPATMVNPVTRWQSLPGFPSYPGKGNWQSVAAAD
ncbi:magnesium-protoporphyrin IX monomethyl ester (oxidative) cyclase [Candidatus Viridilinea mediisalina]|uniref:Aerobic magnesium-protoporphyrin IX monomethyl ester [oxidative] cyclase n=1 Tax=Candidatus Viridilinea mediisalina TaxID=2024553 RepID=A0A2A6RJ63_9CHLR|nr:magnesium-protoporphyrin IX monomethyl ester (oxidative) cyclase [Candidatus Viridilinea mediisalina]PDW02981.1 magnesium-protoporphyrin IX monomethyl ester (oxidative) cyclase [Candidatus Viridilinea mediisalina]